MSFVDPRRKPLPYIRATPLDEIEAIRITPYGERHRELAQNAVPVQSNETIYMGFDRLGTRAVLNGQVKGQMAMYDVGLSLALSTPKPRGRDATAKKNLR
jgi:hypothetical protein